MQILPMEVEHIPQVMEVDRFSFPLPWSASSYRHELLENKHAHFFVAVDGERRRRGWREWFGQSLEPRVIGFVGYWYILDEAHISTIAVRPEYRGHGIGEALLVAALEHARKLGAVEASLEVRVSNVAAQNLYQKYGFVEVGRRKNYYRDNGEDAILMTAKPMRVTRQYTMNNETMNNG
jgi:ribosomal-protein-alanine N-acetyltransferase